MSDFLEVIRTRSSIRAYEDTALSGEQIEQLVEAALFAPTAANRQEFHVSVVKKGNPVLDEIEDERNKGNSVPNNFYYDAPLVLFISADKTFRWSELDAGIVVENVHLAAHSLGLGSLIIGCIKDALTQDKAPYFAKKLDFPENYEFKIAIAVGYPATTKEPHSYDAKRQVTYLD